MLSLDEISQAVRNNLQLIIDSQQLKLAVGPISEQDYRILSGGFGELEWDVGLCSYGNNPNRFEFCIKLVKNAVEAVPSGAALCVYGIDDHIFRIHMIESFVRDEDEHPLKGRMVMLTLMAAYLFCMAVDAEGVQICEPVKELLGYYASFGFEMHDSGYAMFADVSTLEVAFEKFFKSV
ncbi:hypothetical protein [Serratia sp. PL7]|uniref:hypothetical protein n=1 Tax=Serratia sp. PL7 TaxID=2952201 RepID=UPI001A0E3BCE|nr:hypothetical protein [Serratia sp. PL7]MBE0148295.1 hypothetical protein [Serratia fonticola]